MSNRAKAILLVIIDFLILFFSLGLVLFARKLGNISTPYLLKHFDIFIYVFPFWILMYFIEGIYSLRTYNPMYLPISLLRGTVISTVLTVLVFYALPPKLSSLTPKTILFFTGLTALPLLFIYKKYFLKFFSHETRLRNTMVIGNEETIKIVKDEIKKKPFLGYKVIACCETNDCEFSIPSPIDLIAIERNLPRTTEIYQKVFELLETGVQVIDLAKFAEHISGKIPIKSIDESWFVEYCAHNSSRSYDVIKSIVDKTIAIALLILLIPVATILIPVLLIFHGRPIFFKQKRTGLHNKTFTLYKLRSMVIDAEKNGAEWAKPKDARVTTLGKFLRKTRLDELPQLINIIRGDMSLVGPRPERPEIIKEKLETTIPYYNLRHLVKPGVTGWAQVIFRYGYSSEDSKEKLQYDLFYVKNRSIWLDILVIIKTIKTVLTGAGQ